MDPDERRGILRWETPPERNYVAEQDNSWAPVAGELRAHRFEWALIFEAQVRLRFAASPLASRIRSGYGPWGPAGAFEAYTRTTRYRAPTRMEINDGGMVRVYARYVGGSGQ